MSVFKFKKFNIEQEGCAQKVGTDSMVLGSFVDSHNPSKILDIGTGNGALALMMAQKFKNAFVTGVEIQESCCSTAQINFSNSPFKDRLRLLNADINDCQYFEEFDLIISNPPFFSNDMVSSSHSRTIARHQSTLTLLDLLRIAADSMCVNGEMWIIVPKESSEDLIDKSVSYGLKLSRIINVFGKPTFHKRDILVFVKTSESISPVKEGFTIRDSQGQYSEDYKAKTILFHHTRL
jgi:tRNA1Val (adenine37-N6)-methyltransferase